ncbi:MAG: hypothetical protein EA361_06700 [Bacteroidetes bacterium]|nr:MAG: hypothetical protein EA361_06700 [Bacteroidota bacterium]
MAGFDLVIPAQPNLACLFFLFFLHMKMGHMFDMNFTTNKTLYPTMPGKNGHKQTIQIIIKNNLIYKTKGLQHIQ